MIITRSMLFHLALHLAVACGIAACSAATATAAGNVSIQQMRPVSRPPVKTATTLAQPTLNPFSYHSTLVGAVTFRHEGEGGHFRLINLENQSYAIIPDESVDADFRAFLSNAEHDATGVSLTGTIETAADGSLCLRADKDVSYAPAGEWYAAARQARVEKDQKMRAKHMEMAKQRQEAAAAAEVKDTNKILEELEQLTEQRKRMEAEAAAKDPDQAAERKAERRRRPREEHPAPPELSPPPK